MAFSYIMNKSLPKGNGYLAKFKIGTMQLIEYIVI